MSLPASRRHGFRQVRKPPSLPDRQDAEPSRAVAEGKLQTCPHEKKPGDVFER